MTSSSPSQYERSIAVIASLRYCLIANCRDHVCVKIYDEENYAHMWPSLELSAIHFSFKMPYYTYYSPRMRTPVPEFLLPPMPEYFIPFRRTCQVHFSFSSPINRISATEHSSHIPRCQATVRTMLCDDDDGDDGEDDDVHDEPWLSLNPQVTAFHTLF